MKFQKRNRIDDSRRISGILFPCGLGLLLTALFSVPCGAFEGRTANKDGNLVVTYHVADGYKISIKIDTNKKRAAYSASLEADVYSIKVDFVDLNNDGFEDVIIKYADETGYSPAILINQKNSSFVNALRNLEELLYVNTELKIGEDGKAVRGAEYRLKDMTGDGVPELTFYDVFIGKKSYRSAGFRFDAKTTSYLLYQKGVLFEERK
jgi:hypothetical protein